jgi:hypothetical protein
MPKPQKYIIVTLSVDIDGDDIPQHVKDAVATAMSWLAAEVGYVDIEVIVADHKPMKIGDFN